MNPYRVLGTPNQVGKLPNLPPNLFLCQNKALPNLPTFSGPYTYARARACMYICFRLGRMGRLGRALKHKAEKPPTLPPTPM
jgi:hypothetical protein